MEKVNVKESAVGRETRIRKQWNKQNIFEQSIRNREGAQSFVFMRGHQLQMDCHTWGMRSDGRLKI